MSAKRATEQNVFAAADQLWAVGEEPTYENIIALTGGSTETVGPYLKAWLTKPRPPNVQTPDAIVTQGRVFVASVWASLAPNWMCAAVIVAPRGIEIPAKNGFIALHRFDIVDDQIFGPRSLWQYREIRIAALVETTINPNRRFKLFAVRMPYILNKFNCLYARQSTG